MSERISQVEERRPRKRKKKFDPKMLFIKMVSAIVLTFVVLAGGVCFAYYQVTGVVPFSSGGEIVSLNATDASFLDAFFQRDIKMNVAVMGVDKDGTRTDVNFVVHYDSAAKSLQLVSLPRDTRVTVSSEAAAVIKEAGRSYSSVTKLNAVHAYGGSENGAKAAVLQYEDILGIKIDHYVKVNLDAFRAIVDAIGGVEMYVPRDMYWDMRDTGDPLINLKEGLQVLDGEKAEQLVRFRRYADGDVGRIEVQQLFLEALAKKVLSTETIMKNLPDLISVLYSYVETDISLSDALKYINYVSKVDMNNISMETLPGVGQYVGAVSYFIHNVSETQEMVDRIFYTTAVASSGDSEAKSSKDLSIEVSNGGNTSGLASKFSEKLTADGYSVTTPTTYNGTQQTATRIQVKESGIGEDLISYFKNAKVEVVSGDMGTTADIKIILGTGE